MEVISIAQSATATTSQLWEELMFIFWPGILEILEPYKVMQKHGGMLQAQMHKRSSSKQMVYGD